VTTLPIGVRVLIVDLMGVASYWRGRRRDVVSLFA
jgi:hypothetical protein